MANELRHTTVGTSLTQAEFEGVGLHVLNSQATGDLIYASSAAQLSRLGVGTNGDFLTLTAGIPAWSSNKTTTMYIGDTANAQMTLGLTINQAANDDQILAFKSSDVNHGMTGNVETDTFGEITKNIANSGGVTINGYSSGTRGITFNGIATTDITTKSTAGYAYVTVLTSKKTGTSYAAVGADANLFAIANYTTTRFIFDAEGSGHADVEWTTYAAHDDLALVADMESELLLREDNAKTDRRHALEATGIIGKDSWHMENGKPRAMVNMTKLTMLHHGALIQTAGRFGNVEARISMLEKENALLKQQIVGLLN